MTISASAVARVVGIDTQFQDLRAGGVLYLPQRVAVLAQGNDSATYSTDKLQVTSAQQAAQVFGFGSPAHLIAKQFFPSNGDGIGTVPVTFYPLIKGTSAVAATGDITPVGIQTAAGSYYVSVNNILSAPIVLAVGDTVAIACTKITAAINATLDMPVIATDGTTTIDLEAKWSGITGNDINVSIVGEDAGITFTVSQLAGGLVNPDVSTALGQFGNVWETLVLNGFGLDTTILDALQAHGEGRWGELVRKPYVSFAGSTEAVAATATTVSDARKTDRINGQLVAPGSSDLPCVVAARQLSKIARIADGNPPMDYGSQSVTGLTPGSDGEQWDYVTRDYAVKRGSSTVAVKDGVIHLSDTVTFYHPTGDATPAYRYVVDIIKLQNIIFNMDLIFAVPEWDGAPLIPNDQPTSNPAARKPKAAVAQVCAMLDSLGMEAIISDPKSAKKSTQATIDSQNAKRLNVSTTVKLSGNANIISATLNFGFFVGQPLAV